MLSAGLAKARRNAPVFVVGSPRSGTTLLYDTLLSSGGFALYLGESNIFNFLAPRFGDLSVPRNRQKMLDVWLNSRLYRVSGLDRNKIEHEVNHLCRNAGDFLRIIMDEIALQQGAHRWASNAPEEILHLRHIKETIPEALIVHMIRDGRDVSVSLSNKQYIRPFPWKDRETPEGAALYWEWMVRRGKAAASWLGSDYIEVRFEELVREPRSVFRRLSDFLDHDLNYERIHQHPVGTVAQPNSSFGSANNFNPLARWKKQLSQGQLVRIEALVGDTLAALGYELATPQRVSHKKLSLAWDRLVYRQFFEAKLQWKKNRILHLVRRDLTSREVDAGVIVDDLAPTRGVLIPTVITSAPTLSTVSAATALPVPSTAELKGVPLAD
jgi:hypothetical protein